jgi:hypothetical protein
MSCTCHPIQDVPQGCHAHCHIWAADGSVQIFPKFFCIRHCVITMWGECSHITFNLRGTVLLYEPVLQAVIVC